jgi:hypothetical protein
MLATMLQDHEKLRLCAARLRTLVDAPSPCDMAELAAARWDLGSTMMRHLAFEDRHLYSKLGQDGRPDIRATGQSFQAELRSHFDAYAEHAKSWTPDRIGADWVSYRAAVIGFLAMLMTRIDREERELYPLVGEAGIDTRGSAPVQNNWTREAFAIKDQIGKGL